MLCTSSLPSWRALGRLLAIAILCVWATGCASLPTDVSRPPSSAFAAPEQTALGQLAAQRRTQAAARSDSGFYLLDSVDGAFTSRRALIDNAQRSLDLQYYAIHADASTELLLQGMRDAARRLVKALSTLSSR